ncbi:15693_t:CDS:2, partial [Acaulospora colombiana]
EEALGHHARTADPLVRPTYSQILYSWYIRRGDYREAASVMYQRARILGSQNKADADSRFFILTEQADSYIIAINALCLLDSRDAWISLPVSPDSGQVPFEWRELNFGGFVPEGNYATGSRDCEIIELDDMRKEYELCRSRRELLIATLPYMGRHPIESDFNRSPMEILHLYCNIGMFEQALGTARIFQMDMTVIFTMLVDMCLLLTKSGEAA